jgi:hypothetical protein
MTMCAIAGILGVAAMLSVLLYGLIKSSKPREEWEEERGGGKSRRHNKKGGKIRKSLERTSANTFFKLKRRIVLFFE